MNNRLMWAYRFFRIDQRVVRGKWITPILLYIVYLVLSIVVFRDYYLTHLSFLLAMFAIWLNQSFETECIKNNAEIYAILPGKISDKVAGRTLLIVTAIPVMLILMTLEMLAARIFYHIIPTKEQINNSLIMIQFMIIILCIHMILRYLLRPYYAGSIGSMFRFLLMIYPMAIMLGSLRTHDFFDQLLSSVLPGNLPWIICLILLCIVSPLLCIITIYISSHIEERNQYKL